MQLVCSSCQTAYYVEPKELGAEGRRVRCGRCHATWFALPDDAEPVPVFAGGMDAGETAAEDRAEAGVALPEVVPWNDTVMVEVDPSPTLAPAGPSAEDASAAPASRSDRSASRRSTTPRRRAPAGSSHARARLFAVSVILAAMVVTAIGSRESIVRAVPGLAGLYAAIGLPVNLRGLAFSGVRTMHEMQDGIPVLVVEGEVVNVTRRPVELPRLRLAVIGPEDRELYSWTAMLPRSILFEGESMPFRTRLASPPSEGREVLVRFLNRADLAAGGH